MTSPAPKELHRILVIDDNPAIHEDIRKILRPEQTGGSPLADAKALLFGDDPVANTQEEFEIESAYQGEEGLHKVQEANDAGRPYAMAFVDVRMPPGWDGVETITRIWKDYPELQVVICTAYSDYSWKDMVRQIGRSSSMVVLKKPFDNIEVLQLAHALTEKWRLNRLVREQIRDLDDRVEQRTTELREANEQLKREIAERLQVEQALVLSEERFAKAFNANPIPLAIQSLQRETFSDANQGFLDLTGQTSAGLIGRTPQELDLWAEPDRAHHILEKLRTERSVRHMPCRLRTRAGKERDILLSVELIELAGETCLLTIAQDITDQLLLEKQLRHSQKMEAVGQLAAGIAHDFNNMLTVIQGSTSLVLLDHADSPDRPLLEGILSAAQRSARLVRQLLTFSHKQAMETCSLDVAEMLATLAEMLPRMLGEQIAVEVAVEPGLPPITVDRDMLEQALMNLAVNARDAMPQGGRLAISALETTITEATLRSNQDARPGRFLCLNVTDTGCGIPPEVMPRIFEPFYTTKEIGKGTGLGLATTYGIVKQHRGWIEVSSTVNQGTTFHLFIPFGLDPKGGTPGRQPSESASLRGTETIMVVEDEESVRLCVCTILRSHGYNVITANNGVEALAVWQQHGGSIDLLLTDMVMPEGMSGLALAQQLMQTAPALKVIYTSGYSRELTASNSPFVSGHRFLAKPYQSDVLLKAVRESLDTSPVFVNMV